MLGTLLGYLAFAIFGSFSTWFGAKGLKNSITLRIHGNFTWGTVSRREERGRVWAALFVSFVAANDREYLIETTGIFAEAYQIGDEVAVLYNRDDPTQGNLYSFDFLWLWPIFLTVFGGGLLFFVIYEVVHLFI
jgi:hypothetical protein